MKQENFVEMQLSATETVSVPEIQPKATGI
jgi:hypothetical protein